MNFIGYTWSNKEKKIVIGYIASIDYPIEIFFQCPYVHYCFWNYPTFNRQGEIMSNFSKRRKKKKESANVLRNDVTMYSSTVQHYASSVVDKRLLINSDILSEILFKELVPLRHVRLFVNFLQLTSSKLSWLFAKLHRTFSFGLASFFYQHMSGRTSCVTNILYVFDNIMIYMYMIIQIW